MTYWSINSFDLNHNLSKEIPMKLNKNHIYKLSLFLIMMPVLLPIYSEIAVGQDTYCLSTIEYPPLFQKNETPGKGYGIARDITTEAFLAMGYKVTYKIIPMVRCIKMNKKYVANVGAINWFKNAQMMDKVVYANVAHSKFVLFYKKKKFPNGISFSSIDDLKKYGKIGNVRGSSTTKIVQKAGLNIDWASSLETNLKKLGANRYDLAISIQLAGWSTLEQLIPEEINEYECSQKAIFEIPISVTFLKENKAVCDQFINGLITIANNGKYMEILKRYYGKSRIPNEVLAIFHEYQK
jgi:polar amino acid transport system substrate-binding protein